MSTITLPPPAARPPAPSWASLPWRSVMAGCSVAEWLFGAGAMWVGLAVLSSLPILQFLTLGYLLEAGARVARTGKLGEGVIGIRLAARLGGMVGACFLLLLPVRLVSGLAGTAQIIDPGGPSVRAFRVGLLILIVLTYVHLAAACLRGGKLRYFLWPFNIVWLVRRMRRGGWYAESRDAVWEAFVSLRLGHYFWLGLRGFAAALAWLLLPVTLLVAGHADPLLGWVGGLMLAVVATYLPFLQLRMAEQGRFRAAFEVGAVRADFQRAPFFFMSALVLVLALALPLYLLKIETVPAEAGWLPAMVFIAFIYPARLMVGWAMARAKKREAPRHWAFRWIAWLPVLPAALFYTLIVYFTQFTSHNGVWSLYEQHAFTLPVPFFGR
ncbi:MAG: hypothetical protein K2W96_11795 [Gemmataceae bacterium]|nr:hypothetical protein [Gemmataceae bacterium]